MKTKKYMFMIVSFCKGMECYETDFIFVIIHMLPFLSSFMESVDRCLFLPEPSFVSRVTRKEV